jgi:hypothetical protein
MKVRNGFVSNSSSSSFIIAVPNKTEPEEAVRKAFSVSDDHPLKGLVDQFCKTVLRTADIMTKEQYADDYTGEVPKTDEEWEEFWKHDAPEPKAKELYDRDWTVFHGYFSDEDYGLECGLCNMDLNIDKDNLVMIHEGGY